jgi:hypothetical protein
MQQRMQEQQEARPATGVAPEMGSGPERHRTSEGEEVELNPVRARQGVTGHNVRFVLGFSVAAIVVAFFVVYLVTSGAI